MFNAEEQRILEAFNRLDLKQEQYGQAFINFIHNALVRDDSNRTALFSITANIKRFWSERIKKGASPEEVKTCSDLYWQMLLVEARHHFLDSYLLYLEKNRKPKDKFYQPKRQCFIKIGLIQALQDLIDDKLDLLSISMPPGTGKCGSMDSKVLTPSGFVKMRDVYVGMDVIAGNGAYAKILGVYPQGKKPLYDVYIDDGSVTRCSADHLWRVQTRDDRNRGNKYRTIELGEIMKNVRIESGKRLNYSVDYVPMIDFPEKEFSIHPYVLGCLLGDGGLTMNTIVLTTPDSEILDKVNSLLPVGHKFKHFRRYDYRLSSPHIYHQKNAVCAELIRLGIKGKHSHEKYIPKDYLYASYEQRLWLLRGLLDTDGHAYGTGIEYSTSSPMLAEDVRELVHSLGGYCSVKKKTGCGYKNADGEKVPCRDSFRLTIQFSSEHENPFYVQRKRDAYHPKRKVIKRFIKDVVYAGDEECQCIYISDPCHLYITDDYIITHNTTVLKFFHSAVAGWYPEGFSLFWTHSDDIARMYYDGVYDIVSNDLEYTWHEIFPDLEITKTNAKMEQFNIGPYKPFPSVQCTSTGAKNAGKVRANQYLIVDDMVSGIEEALNKNALDKLWTAYSVNALQRKVPRADEKPCKEIHCATRWSVNDVIGRLQRNFEDDPRARFIAIPDVNPRTGKSNFAYDIGGFNEKFFRKQALLMDDISYRCLYKQDPVEREGLLYTEDDIRFFQNTPEREPDAVIAVCDTKSTGIDYMVMPVFEQYGNDYYVVDCICDDSANFNRQYRRLAEMIVEHGVQQCEFEANAGGSRVAFEVNKIVESMGKFCNITSKTTLTNKETRIIVNSDFIKQHVLFRDKEQYTRKSDYGQFMHFLLGYSVAGKNVHDDVPDCLSNFSLFVQKMNRVRPATIMESFI